MKKKSKNILTEKAGLHQRNPHRFSYDFEALCTCEPELSTFVFVNKYKNHTIDFSSPHAVKMLNRALLKFYYGVQLWDIPPHYLCPPIPGRADYIHHAADLLASCKGGSVPKGSAVNILDVGVGANCVYPIIGHKAYGWHFVGSDIDPKALKNIENIMSANEFLKASLECRLQLNDSLIFQGIIKEQDRFDLTICNPPFHSSLQEATEGSLRKVRNLGNKGVHKPVLNFGGQSSELWCPGGELTFIKNMISESKAFGMQCLWFSSLVSKSAHLQDIYKALHIAKALDVKTVDMSQGQKTSRMVAWTFLDPKQQSNWVKTRW